jgi:hypothetical protein
MHAHWFLSGTTGVVWCFSFLTVFAFCGASAPANATDFTLSDSAILLLDFNMDEFFVPPPTPTIRWTQDIPGASVEYQIHFLSPTNRDSFIYQVSDSNHGAGTLKRLNVSPYSNFDLKLTLVSIDGSFSGSGLLSVGDVIGLPSIGTYYQCRPVEIGLTGGEPVSAISSTTVIFGSFDAKAMFQF